MGIRSKISWIAACLALNAGALVIASQNYGSAFGPLFFIMPWLIFQQAARQAAERNRTAEQEPTHIGPSPPPRQDALTQVQARFHPLYDRDLD